MKAETVCVNEGFEETLKARAQGSPRDVFAENKEMLKTLSHGRPPKERM